MSYNYDEFKKQIEDVLTFYNLNSPSAVNLLLGTAAVESNFGSDLIQHGGGPALGPFQMEPPTFNWLAKVYEKEFSGIAGAEPRYVITNISLAILMCRLRYYIDPHKLPPADDIEALGAYWKRVYNTVKGAGTVEAFIVKYNQYCV